MKLTTRPIEEPAPDEERYRIINRRSATNPIRQLLIKIMSGWAIRENSYDREAMDYRLSQDAAFEMAADDAIEARMIQLFSEWSNDIEDMATHYGLTFDRDRTTDPMGPLLLKIDEIPLPPNENSWWDREQRTWRESHWDEDETASPEPTKQASPVEIQKGD